MLLGEMMVWFAGMNLVKGKKKARDVQRGVLKS